MTMSNERREAFKKKQMDRLGQELELARQLVAGVWSGSAAGSASTEGDGGDKAAAVVWIDEHRQRVSWGIGEAEATREGAGSEAHED